MTKILKCLITPPLHCKSLGVATHKTYREQMRKFCCSIFNKTPNLEKKNNIDAEL